MAEPYRLPAAVILEAKAAGDVATVTIEISQEDYLNYPVAPAHLLIADADLRKPETFAQLFEFHQMIAREGTRLAFESYATTHPLPVAGDTYSFCSWWTHWAMDAARDLSADWQRLSYPDDGSHEHCELTMQTISSYTGQREGYKSQHGWITVDGYEQYIKQDRLRVRRNWRSCELRPPELHRIDE